MSNSVTYLRNYDYNLCLMKRVIWTIDEAVDYLASYRLNRQTWPSREVAYTQFTKIRAELLDMVLCSIDSGKLFADVVYKKGSNSRDCADSCTIDCRRSTLQPYIFINWALAGNMEVPSQFTRYLNDKKSLRGGMYDAIDLKKSTVHHERCRAVAGLLWNMIPELTIAQMARRPEITEFGCEGQEYDTRTVCRWLATLKTGRKPGRPRKDDAE